MGAHICLLGVARITPAYAAEAGRVLLWLAAAGWEVMGPHREVARIAKSVARYLPAPAEELAAPATSLKPAAERLVELAADVNLFHDPAGTAWATVEVDGHLETWPIRSKGFTTWLAGRFYEARGRPPGCQAMQETLVVLEWRALHRGPKVAVYTRVAEHGGKVYLDLGDESWRAVEIDAGGWRVIDQPPVRFWRPRGMLPLPRPERGGTLETLRLFVNAPDEKTFIPVVAWLLGALKPQGPYPILDVEGEPGAGKSTLCRILRALVDPNSCSLRRPPREERDIFIAARNSWVVAYDNLSGLPHWMSDALCVLSTGGGYAVRALYSDAEEAMFEAQRPVIVNGIDEIGQRGDFRDRCLRVVLRRLEETETRDEATLWAEFSAAAPQITGALYDAVSAALRRWESTILPRTTRMADFARWVVAAGGPLPWEPGAFLRIYHGQEETMAWEALEDDPLAPAILAVVERSGGRWVGTASELLSAIAGHAGEGTQHINGWPQTPRALAGRLRRMAPDLRRVAAVDVDFNREGTTGRRLVTLERGDSHRDPRRIVDPAGWESRGPG